MRLIKLRTDNGTIFETNDIEIQPSITLMEALKCTMDVDNEDLIIPLPGIEDKSVERVLEWLKYHKADAESEIHKFDCISGVNYIEISGWDAQFLDTSPLELSHLVSAADFLQIKNLTDMACQQMSNKLRGKTSAEMANVLNVEHEAMELQLQLDELANQHAYCDDEEYCAH